MVELPEIGLLLVDGVPRPDLDHRLVKPGLMAAYLGISRPTLWRWTVANKFPKDAIETSGEKRPNYYYRPARICRSQRETSPETAASTAVDELEPAGKPDAPFPGA